MTEKQNKIYAVYGEDSVNNRTCQKWFAKSRAEYFSINDAPLSGRPVVVDSNQMKTLPDNILCGR